MAEYKVVYRLDKYSKGSNVAKWELGCPIFVEAVQVSRNTSNGDAFLQIKVRNITSQFISSFKMTVVVHYENSETQSIEISPLDADIEARSDAVLNPVELQRGDVSLIDCHIKNVKTEKHSWVSQNEPMPLPKGEAVELSDAELEERLMLLKDFSIKNAQEVQLETHVEGDGWWVCPCGMPNTDTIECSYCGLTLHQVKQIESKEALTESANKRLEEKRSEEKRRKEKVKKQKKIGIIVGAIAATLILIAVLVNTVFANHDLSDVELKQRGDGSWIITGTYTGEKLDSDSIFLIFDLKNKNGKVVASAVGVQLSSGSSFVCTGVDYVVSTPVTKENMDEFLIGMGEALESSSEYTGSDVSSYDFKQAISSSELAQWRVDK